MCVLLHTTQQQTKEISEMKKTLAILFLAILPIILHAKHLEFMGIPINGTINSFQTQLLKKGLKPDPLNNILPVGVRGFTGNFAGENAQFYIYYNPTTKVVYQCRVLILESSLKSSVQNAFEYFKDMLKDKYEWHSLTSDMLEENNDPYEYSLCVIEPPMVEGATVLGIISIDIADYEKLFTQKYAVRIEYEDLSNSRANKDSNMDDL